MNDEVSEQCVDFAIIGMGIAGASIAYELTANGASVLLIEAEELPGYHTTGRSAAFYMAAYGNDVVRTITIASKTFYDNPPAEFCECPLLKPSGALYIARQDQLSQLHAMHQQVSRLLNSVAIVDQAFILDKVPQLKPEYAVAAFWEPTSMEIDVAAVLQGYLKLAKRQGARFVFQSPVTALNFTASQHKHKYQQQHQLQEHWQITAGGKLFRARHIVNAAGAWGDNIAKLAGAAAVGLVPKRRTVCIARAPVGIDVSRWPLTIDIDEQFYFKPDGGNILITPADEVPFEPMDVYPEEYDVALGIDRFEQAMNVKVHHVIRRWAGLRTFAEDKSPVVGFDDQVRNFFWFVGQGGYGIQMAPALAKTGAALALGNQLPDDVAALGLTELQVSPLRFQKK